MTSTSNRGGDDKTRPPRWRIADDLRRSIESGELAPGDAIPSERDLAARYGTARNTAKAAIEQLQREGLVVVQQGKRTYVRATGPLIRMSNDRYAAAHRQADLPPFRAECERQGKTGRVELISVERVVPPDDIADRLSIRKSTRSVVRREMINIADDEPVHRVTTWVPWTTAKGTGLARPDAAGEHPGGIYGVLEGQGHVMTSFREEVTARMPTRSETDELAVPVGVPVVDVLHSSIDQHGAVYELTRFVMRADLSGLVYDTTVE